MTDDAAFAYWRTELDAYKEMRVSSKKMEALHEAEYPF